MARRELYEQHLADKLQECTNKGTLRQLVCNENLIDLCSNDYLGLATNPPKELKQFETDVLLQHGATGSRLVTGNSEYHEAVEAQMAEFHACDAALLFNSGYTANLALLSSVPQSKDLILYDSLCHASIREGIRLSTANSYPFRHNDLEHLESKLKRSSGLIYVVVESLYSMDGDLAPLTELAELCDRYAAALIVDEAHTTGIFGPNGAGLVQQQGLQDRVFARMHSFGKALGCHGAIIVGSRNLYSYLVNFAKPFMFSTAPAPSSLQTLDRHYQLLPSMNRHRSKLLELVEHFTQIAQGLPLPVSQNPGPIQYVLVRDNDLAVQLSLQLRQHGINIFPIRSPSVASGTERLRVSLHSFNSTSEIDQALAIIEEFLSSTSLTMKTEAYG